MKEIYGALVGVHIFGSAVGLLSLVAPLVTKKGGRGHRIGGWIFGGGMAVSVVTGVLVAASWIAIPSLVKSIPAEQHDALVAQLRMYGWFFGLLSALAGHALIAGIGAIRNRDGHAPTWAAAERAGAATVTVLGVLVSGLGGWNGQPLLIAFGLLSIYGGVSALRPKTEKPWVVSHLDAMLGCATVATTAFTVQLFPRLGLGTRFDLIAWLAPLAVGQLATWWWTRRLTAQHTRRAQ